MVETHPKSVSEAPPNLPLPDGTMYCQSKGVCPDGPPFSVSPLEAYVPVVGEQKIERLLTAVKMVKDLKILELNSSPIGGGVAEMLLSCIPFLNQLGIDIEWKVIQGSPSFYEVTKCIHNLLQGRGGCFTSEMERIYFNTLEENGNDHMVDWDADVVLIHDPQPLGLAPSLSERTNRRGKWLWRCHIDMDEDTLKANPALEYFMDYWVEPLDGAIFSAAQYIIYEITTQWLASLSLTLALLELSGVGLVWLVFYPPAVYRRWINRAVIHHARAA